MFVPQPAPSPVRLLHVNGRVWEYPNLGTLVAANVWVLSRNRVGPAFRVPDLTYPRTRGEDPAYRYYSYVIRRNDGEPITLEECQAAFPEPSTPGGSYDWFMLRYPWWRGIGPVPGTRKRKAGGQYYRRPKTSGSHRAAVATLKDEGEPEFRAARRHPQLASAWDDIPISAMGKRSWKRHRGAQWAPRKDRAFKTARVRKTRARGPVAIG